MRPLSFFELGHRMAAAATEDSERRTAINRLYYGLHHEACCRYFRATPLADGLGRNNRHSDLRDRFNKPSDAKAMLVATRLRSLMEMREEADYQIGGLLLIKGRTRSVEDVLGMALSTADQLLEALESYSAGPASDGCRCLIAQQSFGPGGRS